jgi:hypothetical protein
MIEQKPQSVFSIFRLNQLLVSFLIGVIIASVVFLTVGAPFSLDSAAGKSDLTVANLATNGSTASNPDVQVFVDQAYVNKIVNNEIKDEPNFSNAVVDLQPPNLALITMDVHVNALFTVRPTATLEFEASGNKVQIQITKISLGGYAIPLALIQGSLNEMTQKMQARINDLTDAMQQQTGLELDGVNATDVDLILNLGEKQSQLRATP